MKQKELAITLSKLAPFVGTSPSLEQYSLSGDEAAFFLSHVSVFGKRVIDLGCGNGILGYGCFLLGASSVTLVDVDSSACAVAQRNCPSCSVLCSDVSNVTGEFDVVVMNPPFGIQQRKADKLFLEKAFSLAPVVYSLHTRGSEPFLQAIARDYGYDLRIIPFTLSLSQQYTFHEKNKHTVHVLLACFTRNI